MIAESLVQGLRKDAQFLLDMCSIYPGDPTGEISLDAMVFEAIADHVESVDWDKVRDQLKSEIPKVEVTYIERKLK